MYRAIFFNRDVCRFLFLAATRKRSSTEFNENMLRCAVIQVRTSSNRSELFSRIERMVQALMRRYQEQPPQLICLPEAFTGLYGVDEFERNAERFLDLDSGTQLMSKLAQKHGAYVVGGVIEREEKEVESLFNTIAVLNPKGRVETRYRKMHLSKVKVGRDETSEGSVLTKGKDLVYFDIPGGWRIGLLCCFDLRFSEMSDALAKKHGCNILLYPSAWLDSTGKLGHWETLLRARALDTQAYVVGVNTAKDEKQETVSYGHSQVVDPLGRQLFIASYDEDDTGIAEFAMRDLIDIRENAIPLSSCRRVATSYSVLDN